MSQNNLPKMIQQLIASGRIIVHNDDALWFDLLRTHFPVRASGICWDQISSTRSRYAESPRGTIAEKADAIRAFLIEFSSAAGIGPDDMCVVLGDGAASVAFEMSFSTLLDTYPVLFSAPQGTYVIKPDGSWCFSFTFEEDMYYARSPLIATDDHSVS